MLVLGRKRDQKVLLPELGISIQILSIRKSTVSIGIDAPTEVRILREEASPKVDLSEDALSKLLQKRIEQTPEADRHRVRNELNSLSLALQSLREEVADNPSTEEAFARLIDRLNGLTHQPTPDKSSENQPTVLVVEDDANEREMLAGFLRLKGYNVAAVSNGLDAIQHLNNHPIPRFVLVDMHMPKCNGATVVRLIREAPMFDNVKVYAISGSTESENDLEGVGLDGWYMKPLDPRLLINAMESEVYSQQIQNGLSAV